MIQHANWSHKKRWGRNRTVEIFKDIITKNFSKIIKDIKSPRFSENTKQGKTPPHTLQKKKKKESHLGGPFWNCWNPKIQNVEGSQRKIHQIQKDKVKNYSRLLIRNHTYLTTSLKCWRNKIVNSGFYTQWKYL